MMDDRNISDFPPVEPISSGLRGRCPRCGTGPIFEGYLKLRQACPVCKLDLGFADAGDGPAVFVILLVGFLVCGLALWVEVVHAPPLWFHLVLWLPLTAILSLLALRGLKGVLINAQYVNKAREGEIDIG